MDTKKVSFSFSKVKKKANVTHQNHRASEENVQYITTFDGKDLRSINEENAPEKQEFCIPVRSTLTVAERIILHKKRKNDENSSTHSSTPSSTDDISLTEVPIEQLAIEELMNGPKNVTQNDYLSIPSKSLSQEETDTSSEVADYEKVSVSDFGYAMIRGMGWAPGKGIGKKQKVVDVLIPDIRARSLGLGAESMPNVKEKN